MRKRVMFDLAVRQSASNDEIKLAITTALIASENTLLPDTLTITAAAQGEARGKPNKTEQRLYDITFLYHKQRGHNQYFERCEHEECIQTRDVLNFRINWTWYDKAYLETASVAAEDE